MPRVTAKGPITNVDLGFARFKLRQALLLLAQCQFVVTANDGKTFVLTKAGRLRLERGIPEFE